MKNNSNPYSELINVYSEQIWNSPPDSQLTEITRYLEGYQESYLEIGSGSGNFILNLAKMNPDNFYIGIELRYKRCVRTIQKAQKEDQNNLLIIREDANRLLPLFPMDTFSGIYINFPDPWNKNRWLKHRLISNGFLVKSAPILKKNGFLSLKTDHENYYTSSKEVIDQNPNFKIVKASQDLHQSEFKALNVLTEFEQLFLSKNQPIYFLEAQVQK